MRQKREVGVNTEGYKNCLSLIVACLMTFILRNEGADVVFCGFSTIQVYKCPYSASILINLIYFPN